MNKQLTWLGHNCWLFQVGTTRFLIDPFLQTAAVPIKTAEIQADYLLVSHGHSDHCADALSILKRTGATLVAMAEVATWFENQGISQTEAMNIGGSIPVNIKDENGKKIVAQLMMVPALHSSTMPDGSSGGNSCGFFLSIPQNGQELASFLPNAEIKPMSELLAEVDAFSIYFACDTGYFHEMNQLGDWKINVAVLPVGDRFTMGPSLSLDAIRSLKPFHVVPAHYNTWPPIAQNIQNWSNAVRKYSDAQPVIPTLGQTIRFE